MIVEIHKSFEKDASALPAFLKSKLASLIEDIEKSKKLSDLANCKKLKGFKSAYRIRIGSYRIGLLYIKEKVFLVRILNRKDIYKYFP